MDATASHHDSLPAGPRGFLRLEVSTWSVCAGIAAILVVSAFFLPLWRMTLQAPQYPNDLQLTAYGTTMKGDLHEINSLNHYAGVKAIDPGNVFEFKLFPFMLFGLVALIGLAAVTTGRLVRAAVIIAAWGLPLGFLVDLQYWLYNFGHNLQLEAPLYPGPFTPRVLGRTKVVNFHSECMVTWGWWALLAAALLLTIGPFLVRFLRDSWQNTGATRAVTAASVFTVFAVVGLVGDTPPASAAAEGSLRELIAGAPAGSTVTVPAGHYRGAIVIDKPLTLVGVGWPIIDGEGTGDVVRITAENVTLRGFVIQESAREVSDEPSGVRVLADHAVIEGNRLRNVLYGIALHESDGHRVLGNDIESFREFPPERRGHALYLYYTRDNILAGNVISYAKDGIFINFSERNQVLDNRVTDLRYGVHFMYADSNYIAGNVFRDNLTGGSVMYSKDLKFEHNEFAYSRSPASGYGLLFKDVDDVELAGNSIHHNQLGLTMEGAPITPGKFVVLRDNLIGFNNVALYFSTTVGASIGGNTFVGNLRQVETKGGNLEHHNAWEIDGRGNYWDDYRGYDADGDGTGDIAYVYRAAYGELMQHNDGLQAFNYTPAQMAIDLASKWFPVYREAPWITDEHPLMSPTQRLGASDDVSLTDAVLPLALLTLLPVAALGFAQRARKAW